MSRRFQEIDNHPNPMGTVSLPRRLEPTLHVDVFEVKFDDGRMAMLCTAFPRSIAHEVRYPNRYTGELTTGTVDVASVP